MPPWVYFARGGIVVIASLSCGPPLAWSIGRWLVRSEWAEDLDGPWHLVDYKTNRLPDEATCEQLEAYYDTQPWGYADLLREQSGIAVATVGIWWGDA
jgi:hypothetical protein